MSDRRTYIKIAGTTIYAVTQKPNNAQCPSHHDLKTLFDRTKLIIAVARILNILFATVK